MSHEEGQGTSHAPAMRSDTNREIMFQCDGQRPACKLCSKAGAECVFDANPGESWAQMLRRENQELKTRLANAEWLLTAVFQGPQSTRAWIREAIAAGARPDDVFQQLQSAPQLGPDGPATSSQRDVYAVARVASRVEPEDPSATPYGWMGPATNTDSSPYGSAPSLMEDTFPWSHNDSFYPAAPWCKPYSLRYE